jgi:uncharacterized membrane protein
MVFGNCGRNFLFSFMSRIVGRIFAKDKSCATAFHASTALGAIDAIVWVSKVFKHGNIIVQPIHIGMAKKIRSFAKALSWRILASTFSLVLVFIITGDIAASGLVGIFDFAIKTFAYYFHERAWAHINWGRTFSHGDSDE